MKVDASQTTLLMGTVNVDNQAESGEVAGELAETAGNSIDPGLAREEIAGGPLLIAAYCAIWLILFFYIFRTFKSVAGLESRLEGLERRLDAGLEAQKRPSGLE